MIMRCDEDEMAGKCWQLGGMYSEISSRSDSVALCFNWFSVDLQLEILRHIYEIQLCLVKLFVHSGKVFATNFPCYL